MAIMTNDDEYHDSAFAEGLFPLNIHCSDVVPNADLGYARTRGEMYMLGYTPSTHPAFLALNMRRLIGGVLIARGKMCPTLNVQM